MENVKELIKAVLERNKKEDIIGFEVLGTYVTNPLMDTSQMAEVDPVKEYGEINVKHYMIENISNFYYEIYDTATPECKDIFLNIEQVFNFLKEVGGITDVLSLTYDYGIKKILNDYNYTIVKKPNKFI